MNIERKRHLGRSAEVFLIRGLGDYLQTTVTGDSGARKMDRGPVPSGKYRARANRRTCAEAEVRIGGDGVVMDGDGVVVGIHVSPVAAVIDP